MLERGQRDRPRERYTWAKGPERMSARRVGCRGEGRRAAEEAKKNVQDIIIMRRAREG